MTFLKVISMIGKQAPCNVSVDGNDRRVIARDPALTHSALSRSPTFHPQLLPQPPPPPPPTSTPTLIPKEY
ncbi:hypothetical protein M0802_000082 [Mischocyttarus mexicanus]|nr:hypothetical protein M0802_000082 [Mischocyttarus mexicanus]